MFWQLALLIAANADNIKVHFFSDVEVELPPQVEMHIACDLKDVLHVCHEIDADFLILRGNLSEKDVETLENGGVDAITWSHNFETPDFLSALAASRRIVANVCVGQQQLDRLRDHPAVKKSCAIGNFLHTDYYVQTSFEHERGLVSWMGSLVPSKGFHILARLWPQILESAPTAKLRVIGGGLLYAGSSRDRLGPFGLAEESYEAEFMRPLMCNGELLDGVEFCGVLGGFEKTKALSQSQVGVVNPKGSRETFCLTAVEYGLAGVPVVAAGGCGLLDTVVDGGTGFLVNGERGVAEALIRLLSDASLSASMGEAGKALALERWNPQVAWGKWSKLFDDPLLFVAGSNISKRLMWMDFKWAREANRVLKTIPGLGGLPSLVEYEAAAKRILNKLPK